MMAVSSLLFMSYLFGLVFIARYFIDYHLQNAPTQWTITLRDGRVDVTTTQTFGHFPIWLYQEVTD